jgi:transposase
MSKRRKRREYSDEFKTNIVKLYNNGKPRAELIREYELSSSTLAKWINNYNNSGSFKASENRSEEENRLLELEKENKQLRMENDILKQAALILGQKSK